MDLFDGVSGILTIKDICEKNGLHIDNSCAFNIGEIIYLICDGRKYFNICDQINLTVYNNEVVAFELVTKSCYLVRVTNTKERKILTSPPFDDMNITIGFDEIYLEDEDVIRFNLELMYATDSRRL